MKKWPNLLIGSWFRTYLPKPFLEYPNFENPSNRSKVMTFRIFAPITLEIMKNDVCLYVRLSNIKKIEQKDIWTKKKIFCSSTFQFGEWYGLCFLGYSFVIDHRRQIPPSFIIIAKKFWFFLEKIIFWYQIFCAVTCSTSFLTRHLTLFFIWL